MEDLEIIEKDDVVSTAILLHKFPHEVRDQMDAEDMIEVLGHQMAVNTEQRQAAKNVNKGGRKGHRPQTFGDK